MCTASSTTSSFVGWAKDAVFSGLAVNHATRQTELIKFSEWSSNAVFSGLPTGERGINAAADWGADRKEDKSQKDVANDNGSPNNEKHSIPSVVVGGGDESNVVKKIGYCKKKLFQKMATQAQCTATDRNNDEEQARLEEDPAATPHHVTMKKLQEEVTDDDDAPNENSTIINDVVVGGDKSKCVKKLSSCKINFLQSAAQTSTTPYQRDDFGGNAPQHSTNCKSKSHEGVAANDNDSPKTVKASFLRNVVGHRDENNGEKYNSSCDHKLIQVAAHHTSTAPNQSNDVNGNVPQHSTNSKNKFLEGVANGNDSLHAKASFLGDGVGGADESNGVQKFSLRKNKLLQVALQNSATASDKNYDEHEVQIKKECTILDLIVSNDRCETSASERGKVESRAIIKYQTLTYNDWASSVVFLGLRIDKPDVEKQSAPSFKDWAGGVVFNDLPFKVHVQGETNAQTSISGMKNTISNGAHIMLKDANASPFGKSKGLVDVGGNQVIANGTSDVALGAQMILDGANTPPSGNVQERCLIDASKGLVDVGGKLEDSLQSEQKSLCIKYSHYEESQNGQKRNANNNFRAADRENNSFKPRRSDGTSFNEWAVGVVHSRSIAKPETKVETISPFKDWATGVVFNGMNDKKKSGLAKDIDIVFKGANEKVNKLVSDRLVDEQIGSCLRGGKSVDIAYVPFTTSSSNPNEIDEIDDSLRSEKSVEFADFVLHGTNDVVDRSGSESEKSVDLTQIFHQSSFGVKASKGVTFRGRDSYIQRRSFLWKSGNSTSIAESSMDFGTLLLPAASFKTEKSVGGFDFIQDESNASLPSRSSAIADSEMANLDMDLMEKSVGNVYFSYDDRNSSLPQSFAMADSQTANFNMDMMVKSVGNFDFIPDESNSSLPQPSAMAGSQTANLNMDMTGKFIGNIDFNSNLPPQCAAMVVDSEASNFDMDMTEKSVNIDSNYDFDTREEMLDQEEGTNKQRSVGILMEHPTNNILLEREEEIPDQSLLQQKQGSDRIKDLIRRHKKKNDQRGLTDKFAGADEAFLNGQVEYGRQVKGKIPSNGDTNPSEKTNGNANGEKFHRSNQPPQYTIPVIMTASVMKERAEDKVGLVFSSRNSKIVLTSMTPNSPFRDTTLSINDEVLMINGHRLKNAKKAAEFIKMSKGKLAVTAFNGMRPKESELEMMRLSSSDCKDIHFFTNNGMVHIIRAGGRFTKSGKIKTGDICLSINGNPVHDADRASGLIREALEVDRRSCVRNDFDFVPDGGLVIMLVFSLAKLRLRLIKNICIDLPLKWNEHFNECAIKFPSRNALPMLHIHNDGNCEDILETPEEIDPKILNDVETFASKFYSQFQDSMTELHEAMQNAIA